MGTSPRWSHAAKLSCNVLAPSGSLLGSAWDVMSAGVAAPSHRQRVTCSLCYVGVIVAENVAGVIVLVMRIRASNGWMPSTCLQDGTTYGFVHYLQTLDHKAKVCRVYT